MKESQLVVGKRYFLEGDNKPLVLDEIGDRESHFLYHKNGQQCLLRSNRKIVAELDEEREELYLFVWSKLPIPCRNTTNFERMIANEVNNTDNSLSGGRFYVTGKPRW